MTEFPRVSIVGLGKLGAPMAACFAHRGLTTFGVDVDSHKVEALNRGAAPVYEPRLQELIETSAGRLTATTDLPRAVLCSDVTFIVVATPSEKHGGFSLQYVLQAAEQIGAALREKDDYHLVVLTSTVMPGATGGELLPLLEARSGKKCGTDFGLCYSPEFIALGSVVRDFLNPDFVLIGESDARAGEMLAAIYRQVCENNPPAARMNFVNAELAKISVNTFVTTKITFANMLARICEKLPGADVDVVTGALGLDSRIGRKYLTGAIAYGGPCFPRDNLALGALARELDAPAVLAEATDRFNRRQIQWLSELVKSRLPSAGSVGILGLSYKPNSDVVEEAPGLLLAQALAQAGVRVVAYDPVALPNAARVLDSSVSYATSLNECIRQTNVVIVTTPWEEFRRLTLDDFGGESAPRVLIDCWRLWQNPAPNDRVQYLPLGQGDVALYQ